MVFNIDIAIFVGFLAINLVVGLYYGKGVKTLKDYALGGRNFSTGTLASTLIATWIGGGFFAFNLSKAYSDGLPFITAVIGNGLAVFILGYFYSLRLGEFLGNNSIAEVMGNLYGKKVRVITAIAAICLAAGYTGLQIKILSNLINWSLGVNNLAATIAGTIVVITYSTFGGIRSVTFTDLIQFLTFGAFVPGLALLVWGSFSSPDNILSVINNNPLFDYHQLFTVSWLMMFLWFAFPDLDPSMFQRVLMARNVTQIRKSFIIASFGCIVIIILTSWIGVLMLAKNKDLNPDQIITFIIENYSYVGLRGLTMAGIAAMGMSTVDSYLNSASVLFANDLCKPLGIRLRGENSDLLLSRFFAVFIGIIALIIALSQNNLFDLTLLITNFYMPIVTVPMTLAIFGFRSTGKSVLIGMLAGFCSLLVWRKYMLYTGIDSVIPGMIANAVFFLGSHYLLNQPGGWVKAKPQQYSGRPGLGYKDKVYNFIQAVKQFKLLGFCYNNKPKQEFFYTLFGIFCIISICSAMYSLPHNIRHANNELLDFIYHTVLVLSTVLLTYPIWPYTFKNKNFIAVAWCFIVPYTIVFSPMLLVIISNFGQLQLMIFMVNLIMMATIFRWQIAIILTFISVLASIEFYLHPLGIKHEYTGIDISLQFKIMYTLLSVSSVLIAFFKPKQEQQILTEQKSGYFGKEINKQKKELERLIEIKNEILRNIEHEAHTPITGITSMGQVLYESYDKFTDAQRRKSLKEIAKSSERLSSLVNNLVGLSRLSSLTYQLNKEQVDLSDLVYDRIDHCKKLYLDDKELEFFIKVEDNIIVNCDENYIKSTLDNLIINAIQYSKEGTITVELAKKEGVIEFSIQDEGIGIPTKEIYDIFESFTVSSKTKSRAGGRGIGLALCKKAIDSHGGRIWAESDGEKGAKFVFTLPLA